MKQHNSYRQILRSSTITGGASVINTLIALVRMKVIAILLGPSGIGLISLLQGLMNTASAMAALGFGTVGTLKIAETIGRDCDEDIAAVQRALFWGSLLLAIIGGLVFWSLRNFLATYVLHNASLVTEISWLSLGVAFNVISGSQGALLNGMRRVSDMARVSIGSALLSAILSITVILLWGRDGIIFFVLAAPLASFIFGCWYSAKLPSLDYTYTRLGVLIANWKIMVRLGASFMVTGVVVTVGHLMVRILVQSRLGELELGYFQSAWLIAMTYMGFVLGAMGSDYYPRLASAIKDHAAVNRLVNEQSEVALLLAGPVILAMLAFAPWVIKILYSSSFGGAVTVLQWQVMGDVLKIVSWPLGFIILAASDGRTYMVTESFAVMTFALLTWVGLPLIGIEAAGVAFLGMYILYLPLVYFLAHRRTGFKWSERVIKLLLILMVLTLIVFLIARWSKWGGAGFGLIVSVLFALYGIARLGHMADISGPIGKVSRKCRELMMKLGVWSD